MPAITKEMLVDRAADRLVAQTVHFTESLLAGWSSTGEE